MKRFALLLALALPALFAAQVQATAPVRVEHRHSPEKAICQVRNGGTWGSGCLISPRRKDGKHDVLTAAHCCGPVGSSMGVVLSDGRQVKATVAAKDDASDCAWVVTDGSEGRAATAPLARSLPANGARVWQKGHAAPNSECRSGRRCGMKEEGVVVAPSTGNGRMKHLLAVMQGDSGGPVFNTRGEVIGALSTYDKADHRLSNSASCLAALAIRPGAKGLPKAPPCPGGACPPQAPRFAPAPALPRVAPPPVRYYYYAPPPVYRGPVYYHAPMRYAPRACPPGGCR